MTQCSLNKTRFCIITFATFEMASENIKWADHCSSLIIHSKKLINALYVVKNKLERENDVGTISLPELSVSFRNNLLKPEPQDRPVPAPIALFIDPGINKIRKQITKAFPEWKDDLGKVLFAD